jgi:hypothetical protein
MKKITAILGVLAAVASLSLADSGPEASAKDTKKVVQNNFVETAQKGVKLSGYVDAGYSYNFTGAGTDYTTGRFGTDTAKRGDFNLYAFKLALEKALTSENKAQAGFRADVIIGEDANYLRNRTDGTATGNVNDQQDSNALFLEQAYAQFRVPVGNGWDWKVGKFVAITGYEVIERPANMNTTYGLLWQNAYPLWYTGVLTSYRFDDYLDGKLGVVNGSNSDNNTTTADGANNNSNDGVAVLAALNVTAPGGNANWSNNFQWSTASENDTDINTANNSTPVASLNGGNGSQGTFIYNSWGNWAPKFADDKLLFAFDAVLGSTTGGAGQVTWYGASAYTKYQFNDWFYLASRGEYFGSSTWGKISGVDMSGYTGAAPSLWSYTLTAGFNVIDNLLIRAEYRLDWGNKSVIDTSAAISDANASSNTSNGPAHYAGAEVVYSF